MTMPVYKITWILLLFIGFDRFDGLYALCKADSETPSMPICVSGEFSSGAGRYIYLDTSGAPDFTKVECKCDLSFSARGTVVVSYRVETETLSNCFVKFKTVDSNILNWGCQNEINSFKVAPGTKSATYTKSSSLISDWHACIGIQPDRTGVTVRCYPYQVISNSEQEQDNAGPLVGGVIGGGVLVSLIVAVVCFIIWIKKNGEPSTGQGKRADFVAPLGKEVDNRQIPQPSCDNIRVRTQRTPTALPTRTQHTTEDQEDIHTYDYVDDNHVGIATVEPTVRQPLVPPEPAGQEPLVSLKPVTPAVQKPLVSLKPVTPAVQKPVIPPREDDAGYLQPSEIGKAQYSSLDKTLSQDEPNYLGLHPIIEAPTEANANDYLQLE